MAKQDRHWQVPPFTASPQVRMAWIRDINSEAEMWMKGQNAYRNIQANLALIAGQQPHNEERSSLRTNKLKYSIRKIVATLAQIKEIGTYGSDVTEFQKQAEQQNRVVKAIYNESYFSRNVRKALQYAMPTGCGYIWTKYKRGNYGFGEGKIYFEPMGLLDVLPFQMDDTNSIQSSYACTCIKFMPIAEAHARFPQFASSLIPVSKGRYDTTVGTRRLDMAEMFRYGSTSTNWAALNCEIHYTFVRDTSTNVTGQKIAMGTEGTSWYYEIPSKGDLIADFNGKTKIADYEDAMLYPNLRLMISSPCMDIPMYDGPAFDWHGEIPPIQYCVDDWPWEGLGYSLVGDISSIEVAKQRVERGMDQVAKHRLDPALAYDLGAGLGTNQMQTLDPFEERLRLGIQGKPRDMIDTLLPDELLNVPEWIFKYYEVLDSLIDKQLGLQDLGNLQNMKLNVQGEQADKMLSEIGPLAKDIEAGIEICNAQIAHQLKFIVPQYFTTKRMMQYIGPDKMNLSTFDFDPQYLIPAHMPEELAAFDPNLALLPPSNYSMLERGRRFAKNLRLSSVAGSGHEMTAMQDQLKYLQLYRMPNFPISPHTVAKKLGIENFGDIEGATEVEKWENWQKKMIELKAGAAELQQAVMPAQPDQGGGGPQKGGGVNGRPASGKKPPKLVQKGKNSGNPRTTITES